MINFKIFLNKLVDKFEDIGQSEWDKFLADYSQTNFEVDDMSKIIKLVTTPYIDLPYDKVLNSVNYIINSISNIIKIYNNNFRNLEILLFIIFKNLYGNLSIDYSKNKFDELNSKLKNIFKLLNNKCKQYILSNYSSLFENWYGNFELSNFVQLYLDLFLNESNKSILKIYKNLFKENIIIFLQYTLRDEKEKEDLIIKINNTYNDDNNIQLKYFMNLISNIQEYNNQMGEEEILDVNNFNSNMELSKFYEIYNNLKEDDIDDDNKLKLLIKEKFPELKEEDLDIYLEMFINNFLNEEEEEDQIDFGEEFNIKDEPNEEQEPEINDDWLIDNNISLDPLYSLTNEEDKEKYLLNRSQNFKKDLKNRNSKSKNIIKFKISMNTYEQFNKEEIISKKINKNK